MELTKIYFFILTVLTNFSLDTLAQDTFSDFTSSTTDSSESGTLEPSTPTAEAAAIAVAATTNQPPYIPLPLITTTGRTAYDYSSSYSSSTPEYSNLTIYDKSLLRTTESTWEPVEHRPALRFGLLPSKMRRGRPKCCRRTKENEKGQQRKMNCRNGSIFSRDARGRRRRKCRRRQRCKQRCRNHYKNTAWGIVGTVMQGLDFFIPKLEFKFHTGTLVFGTKFFSGLVPFIQAKMQAMRFFYEIMEPMLDGVLDALDFGRIGLRSMDLDDDDDDDEDDKKKKKEVIAPVQDSVVVDEKYDAEKVEDYDESDIVPDLMLAKNGEESLPGDEDFEEIGDEDDDDEGYDSPKEDEPVDEDYGIDEDWDSDDDENDVEDDEESEEETEVHQKRITKPQRVVVKRPAVALRPRPTKRKTVLSHISAPNHGTGEQKVIQDFMNRIKDDVTVYHSNIAGSHKSALNNKDKDKGGRPSILNPLHQRLNETQVLNVDNLVLNINSKPAPELYEDEVEYTDDQAEDADDDKLIDSPSTPYKRVKSKPPPFSSFTAFFGAISDAFDSYFAGTY